MAPMARVALPIVAMFCAIMQMTAMAASAGDLIYNLRAFPIIFNEAATRQKVDLRMYVNRCGEEARHVCQYDMRPPSIAAIATARAGTVAMEDLVVIYGSDNADAGGAGALVQAMLLIVSIFSPNLSGDMRVLMISTMLANVKETGSAERVVGGMRYQISTGVGLFFLVESAR